MARQSDQRGQVLVLGMLFAALLSLAFLRYFAVGQTAGAKARGVHGLDAAAYSGALVQARTLNFLAYLNRAQLAHQLAMAHALTLGSWAHFGAMQSRRLAMGNPPAHLIGMFFGADHGRAYLAAARALGLEAQARATGELGQAYAAHEAFVHDHVRGLSEALVRDLPGARLAAMQAVMAAHYPEKAPADWALTIDQDTWPGAVRLRAADAPLSELIRRLAGLYDFLAPRDYTVRNSWSVDSRCPTKRHELRRRGSTVLDASGRWQADDTQSFHALRSNRWIGCYFREYAMGWAWMPAHARQPVDGDYTDAPPDDFSAQDFWRWVQSATQWSLQDGKANPLANSYAMRDRQSWDSRGLAAYYDVAAPLASQAAAGFVVHLRLAAGQAGHLTARSAAESYFSRPMLRADGLDEAPNLFHPYWQARLSSQLLAFPGG